MSVDLQPGRCLSRAGAMARAVQVDTASTCVDWPVWRSWTVLDADFTGVVMVFDSEDSVPVLTAPWNIPTDEAADASLGRAGWRRIGPWTTDHFGRHTATVAYQPGNGAVSDQGTGSR